MGKPSGFLEHGRKDIQHRPVAQRLKDHLEIDLPLAQDVLTEQASRCMDCGIPFCHGMGCPLANAIPEFNDLVYRRRWREAAEVLHKTNNFPEITGRVCPAVCEAACMLKFNDDPVLIRHIEYQIAEKAFEEGWIQPKPAKNKTGKKVAVIGSGPAGLAAAQQLARVGPDGTVFEKDENAGGLLRYGIPDFKLEKHVIDRRLEQMKAEGVKFQTGVKVGEDISARYLRKNYNAICLAIGAGQPRNLDVPGRKLENVVFAMDYLPQENRRVSNDPIAGAEIFATGKVVLVIGGGDTGSDCVGTALRQGAKKVFQFEIMPKPPEGYNPETP